jgi:PTH1 family peptidyl-tRNA hydrolase
MKLIVGLGNPGAKYKDTRHNIGFAAISDLRFQISDFSDWKFDKKINGEIAEGRIDGERVILLKPQTFMNNSGDAVKKLIQYLKLASPAGGSKIQNLIVVHDDIDLPLRKLRIKKDGSSGGHKGVDSIISALGSENFIRLKIGVAPEKRPPRFDAAKFVLKKFGKAENKTVAETIKKATEAVAMILSEGAEKAMNQFN